MYLATRFFFIADTIVGLQRYTILGRLSLWIVGIPHGFI